MNDVLTILVDCDGVLTDGRLHIDHTGQKMFKAYHTRDVRALRELVSMGYEVVIVTADDWEGTKHFAAKVGAVVEVVRDKSQLFARYTNFYAVGDDAWDYAMLKIARWAFVPADADKSVRQLDWVTLCTTKGGEGVMAEVLRRIVERCEKPGDKGHGAESL